MVKGCDGSAAAERQVAAVLVRSPASASAFLCTAQGPSARRSERTRAQASGKSWLSPAAPRVWIAVSRIQCTLRRVAILIALIPVCAPLLPAVFISQAVLSTRSRI